MVVDGHAHLGPLSYFTDESLAPGAAVSVPFGDSVRSGIVLGPGSAARASRWVARVWGTRASEEEFEAARRMSLETYTPMAAIVERFAPSKHKGAPPAHAEPLVLSDPSPREYEVRTRSALIARPPSISPERMAALEAVRLAGEEGQVLVLSPTVALVELFLDQFLAGVVRVDGAARPGAWAAFREGRAQVAIGTPSAGWYSGMALSGIVVMEEHLEPHRSLSPPYLHARQVALARQMASSSLSVSLISPCPSPQALTAVDEVVTPAGHFPQVQVLPPANFSVPVEVAQLAAEQGGLHVLEQGPASWWCSSCRRSWPNPTVSCGSCGRTKLQRLGWDSVRIEQVFGTAAVPVSPLNMHALRDVSTVCIPHLGSLEASASLDPVSPLDEVVAASLTAATDSLVLLASMDQSDKVPRDMAGVLEQANERLRHARDAGLPPFGRIARIRTKTLPDVDGWPGRVFGPTARPGGFESTVCFGDVDAPKVAHLLDRLRSRGATIAML